MASCLFQAVLQGSWFLFRIITHSRDQKCVHAQLPTYIIVTITHYYHIQKMVGQCIIPHIWQKKLTGNVRSVQCHSEIITNNIASYLSKLADFNPRVIWRPPWGAWSHLNFITIFGWNTKDSGWRFIRTVILHRFSIWNSDLWHIDRQTGQTSTAYTALA